MGNTAHKRKDKQMADMTFGAWEKPIAHNKEGGRGISAHAIKRITQRFTMFTEAELDEIGKRIVTAVNHKSNPLDQRTLVRVATNKDNVSAWVVVTGGTATTGVTAPLGKQPRLQHIDRRATLPGSGR